MNKKLRFSRKSALKLGTLVMAGIMTVSSVFVSTPKVIYADNAAAANVVTEIPGTVSTESSYNSSFLSITGFASVNGNVHDRSEYVGTEYYRVIDDEKDFLMQLRMLSPEKLRLWKSQRIWILDISILQSYLQKTFLESTIL